MDCKEGYKVVITGDKTAVSDYRGLSWIGFLVCIPSNYPKMPYNNKFMESIFFPTRSDEDSEAVMHVSNVVKDLIQIRKSSKK